ncbi:MAG: hypothetical protein IJS29_01855 [Selenomonadaceae bacterium]|nr:hypothetical protein [Selenomonadaceae bacterium]
MAKIIKLDDKVSSDVAENKLTPQEISDDDDEEYERYIPVEQSIIQSLMQVREMMAGRLPKKNWREFFKELREKDEMEERAKVNEKRRINA